MNLPNYFNILNISFIALFFIGFIVISLVTFSLLKLLSKLTGLVNRGLRGEEKTKRRAYTKAQGLLEDARKHSFKVMRDANMRASKILSSSKALSRDSSKNLEKEFKSLNERNSNALADVHNRLLSTYESAVNQQKEESLEILKETTTKIEDTLLEEVKTFEELLHMETTGSQDIIKEKIGDEYKSLQAELIKYKESKIQEIDSNIYDILHKVSLEVLGKAVELEDHAELIIKALEEAKKKSLFTSGM